MFQLKQHPRLMWTAVLASLGRCFGCEAALRHTSVIIDGFCKECVERSRVAIGDDLGGEA